uniref:Uncharacterized protein n=1 Tax=Populus trichocarpa TaxID=3694 RepID=A0A3N7HAM6_POPTR
MYSAMEAQESCGRTWQFRIFLGSFLAVTVKTSPFLHGMHTKTFHLLPPCMDRVAENYFNLEWLVRFLIIFHIDQELSLQKMGSSQLGQSTTCKTSHWLITAKGMKKNSKDFTKEVTKEMTT